MSLSEKLHLPGEHPFILETAEGVIEGIMTAPLQKGVQAIALLGHPHSLQGGTMNNKVVTTLARVFKELGIPSLRFNFRGVGLSTGVYNEGLGESQDMLHLLWQWQKEQGEGQVFFAGFSFGSYVAYRAASHHPHKLLITIAPPIHHYNYEEFNPAPKPWLIVQGTEDEIVPANLVFDFVKKNQPPLPLISFVNTGHFFHGKLIALKDELIAAISAQGILP